MKIRTSRLNMFIVLVFLIGLFGLWVFVLIGVDLSYAALGASQNQTLNTTVNISNSAPEIRLLECDSPVDLEAYGNKTVNCNISVYDYDNNTLKVNATLYFNTVNADAADNKNTHYTNSTCTEITPTDFSMNYTCTFDVIYFANNGTWYVNASVYDTPGATTNNRSNAIIMNPLTALYIPGTNILDFGELAVGDTSGDKVANVTNAGNVPLAISVHGWGASEGDGYAMNCTYGDIDIAQMKYNTTSGQLWTTEMYELQSTSTLIPDLSMVKQTTEDDFMSNSTYWKLKIPSGVGGVCNGKLLFSASLG
ncbi:MAG: hypothetical protein KKF44_11340 [Nanoarchaeota archaeon]|nr:hypothetical protein [Nanoarchaeota archaeon]